MNSSKTDFRLRVRKHLDKLNSQLKGELVDAKHYDRYLTGVVQRIGWNPTLGYCAQIFYGGNHGGFQPINRLSLQSKCSSAVTDDFATVTKAAVPTLAPEVIISKKVFGSGEVLCSTPVKVEAALPQLWEAPLLDFAVPEQLIFSIQKGNECARFSKECGFGGMKNGHEITSQGHTQSVFQHRSSPVAMHVDAIKHPTIFPIRMAWPSR